MASILAKIVWKYDWELVNKDLDWEGRSRLHVMWSKPALRVRFHDRFANHVLDVEGLQKKDK